MKDDQLLRYHRQIMLPAIDLAGQEKLLSSKLLIVGLGGLGCPAALYLAAAGVGQLLLADGDDVEVSNLQRQIAHGVADLGTNKAESAAAAISSINPDCQLEVIPRYLQGDELQQHVQKVDLVLDCSDRISVRYEVNAVCVAVGVPLVSGSAIAWEGQLSLFDSRLEASPCYACLYPDANAPNLSCAENGVVAPLTGVIGSLQAAEAVKYLVGNGETLLGKLLLIDLAGMNFQTIRLHRKPDCPVCGCH